MRAMAPGPWARNTEDWAMVDPHAPTTLAALFEATIVGVIRSDNPQTAGQRLQGLMEGGLRAIEITATTPGCFDLIHAAQERARRSGVVLGIGTVRTEAELKAAAAAGARFVVSPHTDPVRIRQALDLGLVMIAGAFTPTEIVTAQAAGAQVIKVFPVSAGGGPQYIRLIRGPLPEVPLWASGDVRLDELSAYLDAGVKLVGLTSALAVEPNAEDVLGDSRALAAASLEALAHVRGGGPLLTLRAQGRSFEVGLKEIRRLPGAEHTPLEAVIPGRRGHAVRLGVLLKSAGLSEDAQVRITSLDGFTRDLPARALYSGGLLHWASDGHPLTPTEGGPLRLYIMGGDDPCDNVKGLSEIAQVS